MDRNIIFSFSLEWDSARIVHSVRNGKKSQMVSDAIYWYNNYNIQEIRNNILGLQRVINEKNSRIRELELTLSELSDRKSGQKRTDQPRLKPTDQ